MRLILPLVLLLFVAMSSASHAQIITHPKLLTVVLVKLTEYDFF